MAIPLPSSRQLITSLIKTIAQVPATESQTLNPLTDSDENTKNTFLTLHALFPNELLPALDLLDRNLITRLRVSTPPQQNPLPDEPQRERSQNVKSVYYVRSAQEQTASKSRWRDATRDASATYYEVRLAPWTCSCPAFTFAAFPAQPTMNNLTDQTIQHDSRIEPDASEWRFGCLSEGDDLPVCKHLLACVLVQQCPLFARCVEDREVSLDELAGWAAGWGN